MKPYYITEIRELFSVSKVATVFYKDLTMDYPFHWDQHDFWEIVYIERGRCIARLGERKFALSAGDVVFFDPNTAHFEKPYGGDSVGIGVISFVCHSSAMVYFRENPTFHLTQYEARLFSAILSEGYQAFESIQDDREYMGMRARRDVSDASLQTIKLELEQFLLSLYRRRAEPMRKTARSEQVDTGSSALTEILAYFDKHLWEKLTIEQISHDLNRSPSFLKTCFKNHMHCGMMDYFTNLKMERAKILIRQGDFTITQIANRLGYADVHYFTKVFKRKTGMTPSAYRRGIMP